MAEHFDELAKALASGVSRRDALKRFVGGVLGGLFAAVGFGTTMGAQGNSQNTCPAHCRRLGITPGRYRAMNGRVQRDGRYCHIGQV